MSLFVQSHTVRPNFWLRTFLITLVCTARHNGHQNADPITPKEKAADPGRNLLRGALLLDKDGVSV
jgi:hypothetical protein